MLRLPMMERGLSEEPLRRISKDSWSQKQKFTTLYRLKKLFFGCTNWWLRLITSGWGRLLSTQLGDLGQSPSTFHLESLAPTVPLPNAHIFERIWNDSRDLCVLPQFVSTVRQWIRPCINSCFHHSKLLLRVDSFRRYRRYRATKTKETDPPGKDCSLHSYYRRPSFYCPLSCDILTWGEVHRTVRSGESWVPWGEWASVGWGLIRPFPFRYAQRREFPKDSSPWRQ